MEEINSTSKVGKKNLLSKVYFLTGKQLLIAGGFIVVLVASLLVWKVVQDNNREKRFTEKLAQLRAQAANHYADATKMHLGLLAKPYAWAIRTELLQSNIKQINQYANDIVREKNFISAMVINDKGVVVSSTDKKFEGKEYALFGSVKHLAIDSTKVEIINDSLALVASPVMSFNSKLGTIILKYSIRVPPL